MKPLALGATVTACVAAAAGGGAITAQSLSSDWYSTLEKPSWQPPAALFGPVWSLLYAMIAVSGAVIFSRPGGQAMSARKLWGLQLGLNFAWTALFFGLRSPFGALVVIVALWCAIIGYIRSARRVSKVAAGLFVPYAAWVSFAAALNAWIWWHNRAAE